MFWLFGQTWIWILIAFILGLVIGYLISWFFRKKQVDVTEERVAAPAKAVSADIDAPKVDVDAPKVDADADTGSFGLAAGGTAAGAGAGFLAGKSGDADAPSVDVDAPALADGDRTEFISPPGVDAGVDADVDAPKADVDLDTPAFGTDVDAPSVDADLDAPSLDADADAPALDASEPTQVMSPPSLGTPDASVDTPSADVDADAPSLGPDASVDTNEPALSMIDTPDVDAGPTEAAYGAASALPLAGGAAPSADYTIKGNEDSMLYHSPESPYYGRTKAEVWFKTAADAEAAGFTAWSRPKSGAGAAAGGVQAATTPAAPVVEAGAYAGSAKPLEGGAAPSADYTIKGNEDSMLYHSPESAFYDHTGAEVWFKSEADAEAAGFTAWNKVGDRRIGSPAAEAPAVDAEPDTGRIPVQAAEVQAAEAEAAAPASPYGNGSALPLSGGAAPSADYTIKGNADSMLYHTNESPYYGRTVAEVWFKSTGDAETAGFTAWNARRGVQTAVAEPSWETGAYPNSAKPNSDGSAPAEEFTVKGNEDSMLFHTTESPYYPRTRAEVWFRTAADAEAAGFTAWNRRR